MKALLLWLVAAWVVSVIADRPCAEYCVYLSSGIDDIDFQPACNCMYEESVFEDNLDDSGIYYEPIIDFIPAAPGIYNLPFDIFNPIIRDNQQYPFNNNPVISENLQRYLNSRKYNNDIEIKAEKSHSTHNRQEKDIPLIKNQRYSAPVYLDMNVESESVERSVLTNTFTVKELELIEQNLLQCVDLYAVLHSRNGSKTKNINTPETAVPNEYDHLSNAELIIEIHNKCSHIVHLVESSLNEIKEARPKATTDTFRANGEGRQTDVAYKTNNEAVCISTTEENTPKSVEFSNNNNEPNIEDNENQEQNIVLYAEPDEDTSDIPNTLSSELPATTAASDIHSEIEEITTEITGKSIEQHPNITPIYTENQYALHTETTTLSPTIITSESLSSDVTLAETSTKEQDFKTANVEGRSVNRSQYEEGDIPLIKIITHEFSNNTVQSFINGTEDIPNGDFKDERGPTEEYQYTDSTPAEYVTSTPNTKGPKITAPDISGNLYFVFNNHQIPAKFVQNLNGSVHLGIDGVTLCNELTQNGKHNSALLTMLCNCYKSGNCKQKKDY